MVKMVRGETSYLVDPRSEELLNRSVPRESWNLWVAHGEPHKTVKPDVESVTTPWAVSVVVPNNEACLVTSRQGRRVEIGPNHHQLVWLPTSVSGVEGHVARRSRARIGRHLELPQRHIHGLAAIVIIVVIVVITAANEDRGRRYCQEN